MERDFRKLEKAFENWQGDPTRRNLERLLDVSGDFRDTVEEELETMSEDENEETEDELAGLEG